MYVWYVCVCVVCVFIGLIHGLGRIGGTVSQATSQKMREQDITITISPARARHHNTHIMQSKVSHHDRLFIR